MLWKLLGLQKKLDALFEDGWITLGLSSRHVFRPDALDTLEAAGSAS